MKKKFLTTRGFPRGVIRLTLFLFLLHHHKTLSKVEKETKSVKETKAEKKTKGEKENSSSPILYNVILAISEEMVGRRANLKAQRGYYSISLGIPRYLRIFLGI